MTKDTSGSPRAPPPRENGDRDSNELSALEAQQLTTSPPKPPQDAPSRSSSTKPRAEPTNTSEVRAVESLPMTASNSSSSNPSGGVATGSAAPYGTRSRNRTGTSRPNYAEDREIDAELELSPPTRDLVVRKVARGSEVGYSNASDVSKSSNTARKSYGLDLEQTNAVQSHHKEPIPGTSTFSAKPTTTAVSNTSSKKRKASSQHTTMALLQNPGTAPPVQAITRRTSMAAQVSSGFRQSNMLTFEKCGGRLQDKKLAADDGTFLEVNDHVYLVCEPPGEPYYLGRIMEFLHINNDNTQPIDALRLNWYYRPKDIGRRVNDTRQVFASMHSDINPLTALRGKCEIKHKSEVDKLDDLRKTKDSFWYEKLYDRYIHRFYDVIPTKQVINVPTEVKKVLDERWKYIVVEPGRGRELTSAVKSCKRCSKYCASNDSVDCAVCRNTYHMSCVNPPLLKKPSRGFAWACGPCSKAQEKKLEARNTPNVTDIAGDADDAEHNDEECDSTTAADDQLDTGRTSPTASNSAELSVHPGTAEQIHHASLWLFRYLGIHCKVEDALDYDDRIYPRASSRLGPRHQANVPAWPGRPVVYVKPTEIKKKYLKGSGYKKDTKLSKDTITALEADKLAREKRPRWVIDEPVGYVHRGEDYDNDDPNNTAQLLYKLPEAHEIPLSSTRSTDINNSTNPELLDEAAREQLVFNYVWRAKDVAQPLYGLPNKSTNVLDVALHTLRANGYDTEKALQAMSTLDKKVFKEPDLSSAELKRFEDGVSKYGSEWHSIKKHVKTVKAADIVRFYYTWKKTDRGQQVWQNYSGRKGKKEAKRAEATAGKLQDDVADEYDDSAFDNDKAFQKKRGFQCKFCDTKNSRQWRRAPNTPPGTLTFENGATKTAGKDKGSQYMVALCWRCAELWRRYAIQWEDIEEVAKKVAQAGGKAWKRKIDEELLKELVAANEITDISATVTPLGPPSGDGTPTPALSGAAPAVEPPRKKAKAVQDRESADVAHEGGGAVSTYKKKIAQEKLAGPPPAPKLPKPKPLPCAICSEMDPMGDQHLTCKECRLTVHRNCYGVVSENRIANKWTCDMCSNDRNPQVSIQYKCMLCPVEATDYDFVEPPKTTTKKKTEKDRERDRLDRENAQKVANLFRKKQEELNKPVRPREPLKRTANNNWVHVTCAIFTPEVKFGNAKALEPLEGIPSIPSVRYDEVCKACKQKGGACVGCHSCRASVHVECAHQAGYILGFDIAPVKGSRRDQFNIVNINGEVGTMAAAIWCKEHVPTKTIVHRMHDIVDNSGLNALQLYVQNFKQADLALTGTVRKATLVNQFAKVINPTAVAAPANRRASAPTAPHGHLLGESSLLAPSPSKICATCGIDVSPKWWPFPATAEASIQPNRDPLNHNRSPLAEGQIPEDPLREDSASHAALAAAALHQNTHTPRSEPIEFQCHKCHWKKVQKEPSPPPEAQQAEPRHLPAAPSTINALPPDADHSRTLPQYSWPPPPPYPPNTSYSTWSHHPTTPQGVTIVNQINGSQSPRVTSVTQPLTGQSSIRQPTSTISHSPHQNGHVRQVSNGYPPSPHRNIGPSTLHMQNGAYPSYASTCPPPQHLTNGGPPPQAPEQPLSNNVITMHSRPSFVPPQASPPILRENHPQQRDSGISQPPNIRQSDGRVNGGASASPSLRNLLS